MKFKPGDRVAFLNETGGGIVTRIISENLVNISIEDGFEIPYPIAELLKLGEGIADLSNPQSNEPKAAYPDLSPLFSVPNRIGQLPEGVYLAMVPQNQEKPLEGNLDFFLINHSDFELLFGLYINQSGSFNGIEYGFVEADSKLLLQQVERNQIEHWVNGLIQLLWFKPGKTEPVQPASIPIIFKPVKIYRTESFSFEGLLRKNAFMVKLILMKDQATKPATFEMTAENARLLHEKISAGTRNQEHEQQITSFLDKHKVDDRIAEIDLHINELVNSVAGMSNTDMLRVQMDYFRRCMEQAEVEKMTKLIFIHGVGQGTLKNEILRYLRNTGGVEFFDAPYARYGMGATEVRFYRH